LHRHSSEFPATAYQVAGDANYSVTGAHRSIRANNQRHEVFHE
jgi:hypothetical protein